MTRPGKPCPTPGCPELAPCAEHRRPAWSGHNHAAALTGSSSGWARQRASARVLRRHRGICGVCGLPGATELDHVLALAEGGTDDDANLRPIHATPCHAEKTAAEARRARWGT